MLIAFLLAVTVGSKQFTEAVILGEIVRQTFEHAGVPAQHRRELGGTRVLFDALIAGDIDVYPEYTGTLEEELLHGEPIEEGLRKRGLHMSKPLGFSNTYAIGVRKEVAARLGLRTLSDLARHPDLRLGFSNEFMQRKDGWPRVRDAYQMRARPTGLDHDLAYRAMKEGKIDATDLYSTDAEIEAYGLVVLEDDAHAFPDYRAVLLSRAELPALRALEGAIDQQTMIDLNAAVRLRHVSETEAAARFVQRRFGGAVSSHEESRALRILRRTKEHLFLVGVSLFAAALFGIPLGVLAARRRRLGKVLLGLTGLLQTIPSLAILVFMIPLFGIGTWPAIGALFLYALLPIVRGAHQGLVSIPRELHESAEALGLPPGARLRMIELPMASRAILAGVQIAAVISVGTATLGALIGAGGYGQPILTGIRLADTSIILEGAAPAALLAILVQALFELLERVLVSKGLRL